MDHGEVEFRAMEHKSAGFEYNKSHFDSIASFEFCFLIGLENTKPLLFKGIQMEMLVTMEWTDSGELRMDEKYSTKPKCVVKLSLKTGE